ncbi:regulatory protein RecX [uncultured Megasphaera sp.]|uniref:regulatory protein RecX n=1 Tax=uncultured Megasphaera sp. TaxID=165188 RepID=UPI0025968F53|nr:regulatory protein RecX [uncultured Megasphaera sp.]
MTAYEEVYEQALKFLAVRFLSEGELRYKLQLRQVREELIDAVVETLQREDLLNDARLARAVYQYYARKGQYGHAYIVNKLKKRKLSVPSDIYPVDEMAVAEQLLSRRFSGPSPDCRKLSRYLQNRGFSISIIREILHRI